MATEKAINIYFDLGLSYKDILSCLAYNEGIIMSRSTLKRKLKRQNLSRRKNKTNILEVAMFIQEEVEKSGQLHGYKLMHLKCIHKGYVVTQETVRLLLHIIDPEGIAIRRRGRLRRRTYVNIGPDFIWHTDGYDKLKPYGICIHGAIDGFSRYIICTLWKRWQRKLGNRRMWTGVLHIFGSWDRLSSGFVVFKTCFVT